MDYRGSCCGLTSAETAVAIAADFRGNCRVSEDCRGNGRGWPRMAMEIAVVIAAAFRGNCHVSEDCRGNGRG